MNKKLFLSMCVAPVAAMAFQQGTHLDLISYFALFDINDWNATEEYANVAKENGSTLVVTWMANGYNAQDLVDGKADTYIRDYAKGVKNYGEEIWLRPLHEANGDWYDWGVGKAGAGNTDANVAEAFRHIVNIFREENVTNVKWVWTTNASNAGTGTTLTGNYPGDEYVDYISIDGYNWGKCQSWSSWQTFSQVFKKAYNALANIDKPLFIAEISSSELGGNKAEWITDMFEHFATDFSRVFAVMWFSQSKEANEGDWALNTSQAAVDAWKAGIAKMKASEPTSSSSQDINSSSSDNNTGIKPTGKTAGNSFRLQDGKLYMQTDKALKASVVQFDYQGRILWRSAVQHFAPGVHAIEVPRTNAQNIFRLDIQHH